MQSWRIGDWSFFIASLLSGVWEHFSIGTWEEQEKEIDPLLGYEETYDNDNQLGWWSILNNSLSQIAAEAEVGELETIDTTFRSFGLLCVTPVLLFWV